MNKISSLTRFIRYSAYLKFGLWYIIGYGLYLAKPPYPVTLYNTLFLGLYGAILIWLIAKTHTLIITVTKKIVHHWPPFLSILIEGIQIGLIALNAIVYNLIGVNLDAASIWANLLNTGSLKDIGFTPIMGLSVLAVFAITTGISWVVYRLAETVASSPANRSKRYWILYGLILITTVATFDQIHKKLVFNLNDPLLRHIPFYTHLLGQNLRMKPLPASSSLIQSAKHPTNIQLTETPNIIVILIESFRADAFTPELMPRLHAFANQYNTIRSNHHFAGSFMTIYGVFSLLYGLDSHYFEPVNSWKIEPYTLKILKENHYNIQFYHTTPMKNYHQSDHFYTQADEYKEFLTPSQTVCEQDKIMLDHIKQKILHPQKDTPQFIYGMINSTHYNFYYPPSFERFTPVLSKSSPILSVTPEIKQKLLNTYRNSITYVDHILGDFLDAIKPVLDQQNTILVITGDHGEGLGDNGNIGHSVPDMYNYLISVPLIFYMPKHEKTIPFSTHANILPTILQSYSNDPTLSHYFSGKSLTVPQDDPFTIVTATIFPHSNRDLILMYDNQKFWARFAPNTPSYLDIYKVTSLDDIPTETSLTPELKSKLVKKFKQRYHQFFKSPQKPTPNVP